jgi:hypothetical protein
MTAVRYDVIAGKCVTFVRFIALRSWRAPLIAAIEAEVA